MWPFANWSLNSSRAWPLSLSNQGLFSPCRVSVFTVEASSIFSQWSTAVDQGYVLLKLGSLLIVCMGEQCFWQEISSHCDSFKLINTQSHGRMTCHHSGLQWALAYRSVFTVRIYIIKRYLTTCSTNYSVPQRSHRGLAEILNCNRTSKFVHKS